MTPQTQNRPMGLISLTGPAEAQHESESQGCRMQGTAHSNIVPVSRSQLFSTLVIFDCVLGHQSRAVIVKMWDPFGGLT